MSDNYLAKALASSKDAAWYLEKAEHASTEKEREWWAGFARICRGDAEHYAALANQCEKDKT